MPSPKKPPKKSLRLRKGDTVQVIAGKDKGSRGTVLEVYADTQRVLVQGVNRITKHTKVGQSARGAKTGGLIHQEAPVHVSNVMLVEDGKPVRVGYRRESVEKTRADGTAYQAERSVRISRRTGKDI